MQAWETARDVAEGVLDENENGSNDVLQGVAMRRLLDAVASGPPMACVIQNASQDEDSTFGEHLRLREEAARAHEMLPLYQELIREFEEENVCLPEAQQRARRRETKHHMQPLLAACHISEADVFTKETTADVAQKVIEESSPEWFSSRVSEINATTGLPNVRTSWDETGVQGAKRPKALVDFLSVRAVHLFHCAG